MEQSRTAKVLKNSKTSLLFFFIALGLNFISRKVFIQHLGPELLGLNTIAGNILGLLNLAELGIGTAVGYNLYKPLHEKNYLQINDIVSIQGWLYRRIAYLLIISSVILLFFFPIIFKKTHLPVYYAYATFLVFLFDSLVTYFVNYNQIVLAADQKEYKITYNSQGARVIKMFLQIMAMLFIKNPYFIWLALELAVSLISIYLLKREVNKEYPWLNPQPATGKQKSKLYPSIIAKTKQVFVHHFAYSVLKYISPIIIFSIASLTVVTNYGNYMLILLNIVALMDAALNGAIPGIGNLIVENNKNKINNFFKQYHVFKCFLASVMFFGFYLLANPFIAIWLGPQYKIDPFTFYCMVIYGLLMSSSVIQNFISAHGLYDDLWAPITNVVLNVLLAYTLGHLLGIAGVILGPLIAEIVLGLAWKPYFLFTKGLKQPVHEYYFNHLLYLMLPVALALLFTWILGRLQVSFHNYLDIFWKGGLVFIAFSAILFVVYYTLFPPFRKMAGRMKEIVIKKI